MEKDLCNKYRTKFKKIEKINNLMGSREIHKKSLSIVVGLKLKLYTCITLLQDLNPRNPMASTIYLEHLKKIIDHLKLSSFIISLSFPNWLELTPSLLTLKGLYCSCFHISIP